MITKLINPYTAGLLGFVLFGVAVEYSSFILGFTAAGICLMSLIKAINSAAKNGRNRW